jgi:hypothetical protein
MSWIGALRQAGLPTDVEDRCLEPGAKVFIAEWRALAEQLTYALNAETDAARRFIATAQPQPSLIGPQGAPEITALKTEHLTSWLAAVLANRDHYSTWIQSHQQLEQLPDDGAREVAKQLLHSDIAGEHWSRLYRWTLTRSQLRQMAQTIPELQQLRSHDQVARRERFQRIEEELRSLDRAEVVAAIHQKWASPDFKDKSIGVTP